MGALKTQDIPVELRTWWKLFQTASYRHDYARVFDDFITMTLTQFGKHDRFDEWHKEAMRSYDAKEKAAFNEMYFELFNVFRDQIENKNKEYYDMFGLIYELLSSQGKKSALGQFFTPEAAVKVISDMIFSDLGDSNDSELMNLIVPDLKPGQGKRILDPCCGSGRMLFIAHVKAPGNFQYGIDIDQLCAKMSALNMMFHGCVGEVVCGNGLFLKNDWRFGLMINPILKRTGIPSIMWMEKENSFIWSQENQKDIIRVPAEPKKSEIGKQQDFLNQLMSGHLNKT